MSIFVAVVVVMVCNRLEWFCYVGLFAANYKNRLIEFTQRANIAMPEYQLQNKGASHAPEFRCSVLVDGLVFTVTNNFFHRRAAEQEVSRVALEYMVKKIKDEGRAIILKVCFNK